MIRIVFTLLFTLTIVSSTSRAGGLVGDLPVPLSPPAGLYKIDGKVEVDSSEVVFAGSEIVSLTNSTPFDLSIIALEWSRDSLCSMSMSVAGRPVEVIPPLADSVSESAVIVSLPETIRSGDSLRAEIHFKRRYLIEPGDVKYLVTDWFPRIYWGAQSQDNFDVNLEYPDDFLLASSGVYEPHSGRFKAERVRRYGIYLLQDAKAMERQVGDVLVRVVHTNAGEDCARLIMHTAADVVAYYKERFGFFPSNHIEIVPGADRPMGGYPAATSLVVIHGMEQMAERDSLHWQWITAHELGHQYWYEYVMPQESSNFDWLMIGLGIYVDREFIRSRGLADTQHLGLMERYLGGVREGLDTRADVHRDYQDDIGFDFNNVVTHGKGYSIISALYCLLGDSLFDQIHSRCLDRFAGRRMGVYDFQQVCEQESRQDLDWFFDQWVGTSRILAYDITSTDCEPAGDGFVTNIRIERLGTLDMPVPVTAKFTDASVQTAWTTRLAPSTVIRFESEAPLEEAVIDARHELAMVVPPPSRENLALRHELEQFPSHDKLTGLTALVGRALNSDINQSLFWGKLGRKLYGWAEYEEALAVFERRAQILKDMNSDWLTSALGWKGLLLDMLGRRAEALQAYNEALRIASDKDYSYDGDPVTINRAWLRNRLETPYSRSDLE